MQGVCLCRGVTLHCKEATPSFALSLPPLAILNDVTEYSLAIGKMENGAVSFRIVAGILTTLSTTTMSSAQKISNAIPFFSCIVQSKDIESCTAVMNEIYFSAGMFIFFLMICAQNKNNMKV